jgi:hypothetical protein
VRLVTSLAGGNDLEVRSAAEHDSTGRSETQPKSSEAPRTRADLVLPPDCEAQRLRLPRFAQRSCLQEPSRAEPGTSGGLPA